MKILLSGANGVVGFPLKSRLVELGHELVTISRHGSETKASKSANHVVVQWDLSNSMPNTIRDKLLSIDVLIHCAPIWLLPAHLDALKALGLSRLIVFSSTSVISKADSDNLQEQRLVSQLANSETATQEFCAANNLNLTIFRPSMIYGYGRDLNVMKLANFIDKYGFMILVGKANGRRQPVHADDLVKACCDIIDNPVSYHVAYNLAGAEVLTYRQMIERIFLAMGRKPRIFSMPLSMYRFALRIAARFTSFAYTPEMADRMNIDLVYSNQQARQDFAYQPQAFLQSPQQDLLFDHKSDQAR